MADNKDLFRKIVAEAIETFIREKGIEAEPVTEDKLHVENPPKPEMGDLGIPLFVLAKSFRMAPPLIAKEILEIVNRKADPSFGSFLAAGPYINVKLNKADSAVSILKKIEEQGQDYGSFNSEGKK
ncbi:MAG: arginine--tRNA ligase, partial [Treponema sp.]|nr:arginine--tRNA ligase [Treponema sp.]